ncbi:hypothetical protein PR202_ga08539 [Eleusine coracana subsp. coracana]|uniref:Uncharacterized protein n=1 Tax=Eleusine coracana subsp. coracana TaxID=191504 RepID=A0AAV5C2T3_ELECO|nr:hypothetical protein QOZ80_1AG0044020 [Eleusine coracana subsp. coracana]GJM92108.1 hypothetical protein PR202_ga08539 [Eleusine coracana subsp. coracana]
MAAVALWWTLVVLVAAAGKGEATPTTAEEAVHAVLAANQLPRGLLPAGIAAFAHDAGSGRFEAVLEAACTARSEVGLRYNVTVTGVVSEGRIAGISGVDAKDLFMWFPVRGIHVDIPSTGVIYFDVGVVFKHFPLSVFDAPPPCTPDPVLFRTAPPQWLEEVVDGFVASGVASQ